MRVRAIVRSRLAPLLRADLATPHPCRRSGLRVAFKPDLHCAMTVAGLFSDVSSTNSQASRLYPSIQQPANRRIAILAHESLFLAYSGFGPALARTSVVRNPLPSLSAGKPALDISRVVAALPVPAHPPPRTLVDKRWEVLQNNSSLSKIARSEKRRSGPQVRSATRYIFVISDRDCAFSASQKASFDKSSRMRPKSPSMFTISRRAILTPTRLVDCVLPTIPKGVPCPNQKTR